MPDNPELTQTLTRVQQTLEALTERVALLEARLTARPDAAAGEPTSGPMAGSPPIAVSEADASHAQIAPAVLLAIAAAVAAYLGERAHVRQVRLISSSAWGQQGRVTVQASHALHR